MVFVGMRRKTFLFYVLLAVAQRVAGQGQIGRAFPCEAPGEDPDPNFAEDNLSCPNTDQSILDCYSRAELCNAVEFCDGGSDEGTNIVALECNNRAFACTPGVTVPLSALCDGNDDCGDGDDETTTLCENKCLLPYYGGCSSTRQCITSEFDVNCGLCLPGFVDADPATTDCLVEIGLERLFYTGSEENGQTEEICAVILANDATFVNGVAGVFNNLNLASISATITPTQRTGGNAASAGADYDNQVRILMSLTAAQPRSCVQISINDDAIFDPNELFDVVLGTSTAGATVRSGLERAEVTIIDNDNRVTAVYQLNVYNVQENQGTAQICVVIISPTVTQLNGASSVTVTFQAGGSATAGQDYQQVASPSALVQFPAQSPVTNNRATSSSQCFTVPIIDDNINEPTENFILGLTSPSDLIIIGSNAAGGQTSVVINDNDPLVTAVYQEQTYTVNENAGTREICVAIVSPSVTQLSTTSSVTVTFIGGSAQAPADYQQVALPSDVLTFPGGSSVTNDPDTSTSQCFNVPIINDALVEQPESFSMGLTGAMGLIAINQGSPLSQTTVTILDDDQFVTAVYQPNSYTVDEDAGTAFICVAIISSSPVQSSLSADSTVRVTFADDSASGSVPNQDYIPAIVGNPSAVLSFSNGDLVTNNPTTSSSRCFSVAIIDDTLIEQTERFILGLADPSGLIIVNNALPASLATVDIISDDFASVGLDPLNYFVTEDMSGNLEVCVDLFSPGPLPDPLTVFLSTDPGTATAPMDFGAFNNRPLTFPINSVAGNSVCTNVVINMDNILELMGERFFVDLSVTGDTRIEPGRDRATITIAPNMAVFRFVPNTYTIGEANTIQQVCIQLSGGILSENVDLTITTSNLQAIAGLDYTQVNTVFNFPAGSTQECVPVSILDDSVVENDESFLVNGQLTNQIAGLAFVDGPATVTITDNDRVNVRIVPRTPDVPEAGGPTTVCVEIVGGGSFAPGLSGIVTLTTSPGSAAAPGDYTTTSVPLTFTSQNSDQMLCVDIPINDDLLCEGLENFFANLVTNDPDVNIVSPPLSLNIIDNDVAQIGLDVVEPAMFQGMLQECADGALYFRINFDSAVRKGPGRQCRIGVRTEDGTAEAGSDYSELVAECILTSSNTFCEYHIEILDDFEVENDEDDPEFEYFSILLESRSPSACVITNADVNTTISIKDDEDCDDGVCDDFETCEELMCPNNFTCIQEGVGDDPHFAVTLSSGKTLCYTVQGEHGFAFNLISNKKLYMNAMFVPDAYREEVTWLGTMGIVINNNGYKKSNMTKLRFEAIKNKIHIDDQMVLEARNIEKITFENGKLIISEAPPTEGYKQPFVHVELKDVELSFSIKFMTEHLDLYWHSTGQKTADSHGLIGQFFREDVSLDEVRKILILPGKEPIPVQRKPLWAFMERESGDSSNFCWVSMNPGYQGEGLIDGSYFDYLVDDVLSTEFKFKKL